MCLRHMLAHTQQLSQLLAKFGKEIVEYIWKEKNLFASKRKQKVLFSFSFFSSLIGLCIEIFLFQKLSWIGRDNLPFFHSWKKERSFQSPAPPQICSGWAAFPQLRGPCQNCLPTQHQTRGWPRLCYCPQYLVVSLYNSFPSPCACQATEEILEVLAEAGRPLVCTALV